MRLMLDTCVVIDLLTDYENLGKGALDILGDAENTLFASCETMRELVVHFNNKRLLNRHYANSNEVLRAVEKELGIEFLPIRRNVGYAYANLNLNESQDHRDPSDHMIIAHAIIEHMALMSSDAKFPFYRDQGLDLIEY